MARDLSTYSFILALCRFISERVYLKSIRSHNGTKFAGAQQELFEASRKLDSSRIKDDLSQRCIRWKFNSPAAYMGIAMDTMVKITKNALKSIVRDRIFTDEGLSTFLTEVESMINSRPLIATTVFIYVLERISQIIL